MRAPVRAAFAVSLCLLCRGTGPADSATIDIPEPPPFEAPVSHSVVERVPLGGQWNFAAPAAVTRIALGDPAIVNVKLLSDREVRVLGLKAGSTDLTVWTKSRPDGETHHIVVGANAAVIQAELAAIPALRDLTAVSDFTRVALRGQVSSLDAQQRAVALVKNEPVPGSNQVTVADHRMIAVEIRFAAVSTTTLKALGLNFQKLGGGFQFTSNAPSTLNGFQFATPGGLNVTSSLPLSQAFNLLLASPGANLMSAISALNSVNLAQVLAEPTLLVRSGEDASFLAGGEIPIPVPQSGQTNGGITIQYRKFGVQLHVHATVLSDDRIVVRVNPEVSELDYQNALTMSGFNIPAITARSTDTTIEIGNGQSFVLAGLMYSNASNIEEKVPGIGSLPIIGEFFKRTQHSKEQQELVIIATPHLVSPMPAGSVPKLPGEGVSYSPSLTSQLLNTRQLDDFVVQTGLARP